MNRRHLAILILTAWVAALSWLVHRQVSGGGTQDAGRWPVPPGSSFQAIRLGEHQIGIATLTVDTLPEGLKVVQLTTIDLPPIDSGVPRRTTHRVEALYSRAMALLDWQSDLLTEHGRERSGGRVEGDTAIIAVQAALGLPPETLTVRIPGPVVLPGAVTLAAAAQGLPRRGGLYELRLFDPIELAVRTVRYTVAQESLFVVADSADFDASSRRWMVAHADTVRAWRLDGIESGLPVFRWTDAAGQPVRVSHPLGATMDRSAFELVNTNFRRDGLNPAAWDSGPTALAYRPGGEAVRPEPYDWVALSLVPPERLPAVLPALDGGAQRRSGDTLYATSPADTTRPVMPAGPGSPLFEPDSQLRALAARVSAAPSGKRVRLLESRVRQAVGARQGPGVSPAPLVLRRGTGTEAERALVAVAVAREAGMPARRVWGVTWQDGAWRVRPWAEVWMSGWTPADAGLGTRPGDRVRLGIGADARFLDLAIRAGRLRLELGRGG